MTELQFAQLNQKGYVIIPQFFTDEEMDDMFAAILELARAIYMREFNDRQIPGPPNLWLLDNYINGLLQKDKDLIGELYDAFAYTMPFLRLISSKKMSEMIGYDGYCFTNRCRIDPPLDERRTYGWHQEIFYTIPQSKFIQSWAPIFRDSTVANGTIEIAECSHYAGMAPQTWTEGEGRATQIIVDQDVVDRYNQVHVEMKVGDLLLFHGTTMHRSGHNTDSMRYSMVGMYHNLSNTEVHWPKPEFKHRGMTQREYFDIQFPRIQGN